MQAFPQFVPGGCGVVQADKLVELSIKVAFKAVWRLRRSLLRLAAQQDRMRSQMHGRMPAAWCQGLGTPVAGAA
jgi:hypothetical protein